MIILYLLRTLISYLSSVIFIGAISWLYPVIIILVIMSALGICTTGLVAAGAKTVGTLLTMALSAIVSAIPRMVRSIARFWRFLRNSFERVMPGWLAATLATIILIII